MATIPTQNLGIQMGSRRTPPYSLDILEMDIWKFGGRYFIWWFWILINFCSKDYEFWVRNADPRGILEKPFATLFQLVCANYNYSNNYAKNLNQLLLFYLKFI